jgi:hypothetical protein
MDYATENGIVMWRGAGSRAPSYRISRTSWMDAVAARSPSMSSSPSALVIGAIGLVPTGEAPEVAVAIAGANQIRRVPVDR